METPNAIPHDITPQPTPKLVKVDSVPILYVPQEPKLFRFVFVIVKYTFIMINVVGGAVSFYLLCSDDGGVPWTADNALIVLGLMFFIILAIVALFGAVKEECYVILTYDLFILVISVISVINLWRSMWEESLILVFVLLSFLFAFLLYRKHPIPST